MENIPHLRYLALCGTTKEKMIILYIILYILYYIKVVILNALCPTVFGSNIKIFADVSEDENYFKIYESTWNIVQFLRVIQSTFELFNLHSSYSI
jgi:hypothetical protein